MRTKRINLYPFNELSEEAQAKALVCVENRLPDWLPFNKSELLKIIDRNSYEFLQDGTLFNL